MRENATALQAYVALQLLVAVIVRPGRWAPGCRREWGLTPAGQAPAVPTARRARPSARPPLGCAACCGEELQRSAHAPQAQAGSSCERGRVS